MADKRSIAQLLSQHGERWNSLAEIEADVADRKPASIPMADDRDHVLV
jgi:hypothetical protein